MEGVGARLGRTSNRYVPTTVFTGPVRRWKKKWVHAAPSKSTDQRSSLVANGRATNVDELSAQLFFYRWTPQDKEVAEAKGRGVGGSKASKGEAFEVDDLPPARKKFKYIPVVALEEQKKDHSEQIENETDENELDANAGEPTSKTDRRKENPDINHTPKGAKQAMENMPGKKKRQDLNESTLDLSLG